jgi:hypothetical protein
VPSATISPAIASLRPEVDQVISHLDNIKVVLDDHYAVATIYQALQNLRSVCGRRRHASRPMARPARTWCSRWSARKLTGQLTLRFAAGKGRGRLANPYITQPDILQRLQFVDHRGKAENTCAAVSTVMSRTSAMLYS